MVKHRYIKDDEERLNRPGIKADMDKKDDPISVRLSHEIVSDLQAYMKTRGETNISRAIRQLVVDGLSKKTKNNQPALVELPEKERVEKFVIEINELFAGHTKVTAELNAFFQELKNLYDNKVQ